MIRKIFLLFALATTVISCNKAGENEYIITGSVKGVDDGKMVTLEKQDDQGQLKPVDTAKVEKGKFTFKSSIKETDLYLVQVADLQGKVPVIVENGQTLDMVINKDSINLTKVTGSYNNDELTNYKEAGMKIQKKMMKFQQDNMARMNAAQQSKDTVAMNSLRKEYSQFQQEFMKQSDDYVSNHPKAFISALIIDGMFNQMAPDIAKIKKYYNALDPKLKNSRPGKAIKTKLDKANNPVAEAPANASGAEIGSMAPEFSAPNPDGKTVSLKESLGKVTVVDFWASWCNPCRAENPNMVALYSELHPKGLNVISVSLDTDAAKWKEAIAKDKLVWNQISNLKKWEDNPIANTYGLKAIPATFVLDANGKIIAKDLRGAELKAKVSELLAAK